MDPYIFTFAVFSLLGVMGVYLALGVPVALWFLLAGVREVEKTPVTWGARVLLFPGCCALWPVLIAKVARSGRGGGS